MKVQQREMIRRGYDRTNSIAFPTILERMFGYLIDKRDAKGLSDFISWLDLESKTKAMHEISYYKYYDKNM